MWDDYVWIVVLGSFVAFFTAFGIGANDVANAFATSVGANTITLTQAVLIASLAEFAGAVLLGSRVTGTIGRNIANLDAFEEDPEILMYGMLCVLAATGIWLSLASYLELPVSTTHSTVGGIIGMGLAFRGKDAVVCPLISGLVAAAVFLGIRYLILRRLDSERRAYAFFPVLVGLTVTTNAYFVVYKGFSREIKGRDLEDHLGEWTHMVAWGLGLFAAGIVTYLVVPRLKARVELKRERRLALRDATAVYSDAPAQGESSPETRPRSATHFFDHDVHAIIQDDSIVQEIHQTGEKFDQDTEEIFKYLQVFTAICDAFAHGSNDVANAVGPLASIFVVYQKKEIDKSAPVPRWILILGGTGIVFGLATYGYNIIRAIGVKLIKVTASRGFSIEFGTAFVVSVASQYGIPLSTTHCQVGATVGVGLMEGKKGINIPLFVHIIGGWIVTLVVVGVLAAAFFAQGAYAPSVSNLRTIDRFEDGYVSLFSTIGAELESEEVEAFTKQAYDTKADYSIYQITKVQELLNNYIEQCNA